MESVESAQIVRLHDELREQRVVLGVVCLHQVLQRLHQFTLYLLYLVHLT